MSQAIVVPAAFQQGQIATAFQGQAASGELSGGITGGYGLIKFRGKVWSIQYNGNTMNLMRDDGDGPRGSIDVVILKANSQLSKTYYINGWDENNNNPPDCASENGIQPDQGVPHPQNTICATCPRNAWGSAPNGGKGKACGDHRRLAVVPLTPPGTDTVSNLRSEPYGGPLLLRCPAASLQDMAGFDNRYSAMGYPYFTMGIKIGFDPAESFPKFTFAAIRPLNEDEAKVVIEMRNSDAVARVIGEGGVRAAPAQPAAQQPAFLEPPPANAVQPQAPTQQVAPQQPVAQPVAAAPVAQPAQPVAAAPVAGPPAGQPAVQQPVSPAGGFGPVTSAGPVGDAAPAAAAPAPVQQPAAQQPAAPQRAMTGFGAAQPEVTQPGNAAPATAAPVVAAPVAAPPVAATAATAPGVVDAFEGSIDERLEALLAANG